MKILHVMHFNFISSNVMTRHQPISTLQVYITMSTFSDIKEVTSTPPLTDEESQAETAAESTNIFSLEKYTNYSISVLAYTSAGDGVPSSAVFCRTLQDGEISISLFCCTLYFILICLHTYQCISSRAHLINKMSCVTLCPQSQLSLTFSE